MYSVPTLITVADKKRSYVTCKRVSLVKILAVLESEEQLLKRGQLLADCRPTFGQFCLLFYIPDFLTWQLHLLIL